MNTDMQHGLTRSESPDIIDFLRETSSGSQTEVPKILSLPDKKLLYLDAVKGLTEEQISKEDDEKELGKLKEDLQKIDKSIKTINEGIKIVNILEGLEAK